MSRHRPFPEGSFIDPNLALAAADRVLAKRWPGLTREQFLEGQRNGSIECAGVAADVGDILRMWLPLAARRVPASPPASTPADSREDVCPECHRALTSAPYARELGTCWYCNKTYRVGGPDTLAEEVKRLRAAIEGAPHAPYCQTQPDYDPALITGGGACDCWKSRALTDTEAARSNAKEGA